MNPKTIRKPDHTQNLNFSYPPAFDGLPAKSALEKENEDLKRQMTRIETRLVVLMNHMGIDTFGNEI